MSLSTAAVIDEYFRAWQAADQSAFQALLAQDVDFLGPMGHVTNAEDCAASIVRLRTMLSDIVPLRRWVTGPDAISWFELHTAWTDPIPVANWTHVEDGLITQIRVTFDPRRFLAGMPQS